MDSTAVAAAHPNIALIKYWGNRDDGLRIPQNGSISMTLAGLHTVTRVRFGDDLPSDSVVLHGLPATGEARARVTRHLDLVRHLAGLSARAEVVSVSDFPGSLLRLPALILLLVGTTITVNLGFQV